MGHSAIMTMRWVVCLAMCGVAVVAAAPHVHGGNPASADRAASHSRVARTADKPKRIVSLNLCLDQLLIDLVDKERIAAVSFLAKDRTLSAEPQRFAGLTSVRGTAEEVLALKPDLVLVGEYTTGATIALLKRLGQNVGVIPLANDFDSMRAAMRLLADMVGERDKADAALAAFDRRIAAVNSVAALRPTALAYQVNSLVSGPNSLLDAAIEAAGYSNLASTIALGRGGRLPLEQLIATPPDLVILANAPDDFQTVLGDNLRHPALVSLLASRRHVTLPMPYWMCATPRIADAIELLAATRPKGVAAVMETK